MVLLAKDKLLYNLFTNSLSIFLLAEIALAIFPFNLSSNKLLLLPLHSVLTGI